MLENVPGILDAKFAEFRDAVKHRLKRDYKVWWGAVQASDFGVPQLRPRAILVAIEKESAHRFVWPNQEDHIRPAHVGTALYEYMAEEQWYLVDEWHHIADKRVAPTLVGGSKKHGGPDLGPTRAKREWAEIGVDALGLADRPPARWHMAMPRLTVTMAAVLQGFDPDRWPIAGAKTAAYRQIGNAFPPPVARAFGNRIKAALSSAPIEGEPSGEESGATTCGGREAEGCRVQRSRASDHRGVARADQRRNSGGIRRRHHRVRERHRADALLLVWWYAASIAGIAIGAFGPWVTVLAFSRSGFDGDGQLTLGAAVLALIVLVTVDPFDLKDRVSPAIVAIILGLAVAAVGLLDWQNTGSLVTPSAGWGLWLTVFSGSSMFACGIARLGQRTRRTGA